MAQKINRKQLNTSSLPAMKVIIFNNGTGTRSTTTSGSPTALPGATGDTSYTAPANIDVDIFFTMTQMIHPSGGVCQAYLSINGSSYGPCMYMEPAGTSWKTQTVMNKYQLAAGATITIGCLWATSGGTTEATNASGDAAFPNQIHYLVIPRT